jgi:hypothetical protein
VRRRSVSIVFCPPTITRKRGSHEAVSSRAVSQASRSRVSAGSSGLRRRIAPTKARSVRAAKPM